jgi:hypothetical protein
MFALQYKQYGGPEVLSVGETPEPHRPLIGERSAAAFTRQSGGDAV